MQIIKSELFTVLIPEVGYKLVNKTNNKQFFKVYLGISDSIDNYIEVVDDEYVDVKYKVEMSKLKTDVVNNQNNNELNLDLLLMSMAQIYEMVEPILAMIPSPMNENDEPENINPLVNMYSTIVKRGLMDIDKVPQAFINDVKNLL
jgi:hypothetical protein